MSSDILLNPGSAKLWKASGGDGVFTFTSKATASGRIGDRVDLGAWPRAAMYRYRGEAKCQASGLAVGNTIDMFLVFWDTDTPGNPDGPSPGSADANYNTQNQLRNLQRLKSLIVDDATGGTVFARSGQVFIPVRYVSPVWWNASGATASATSTDFLFSLTPIDWQSQ